MTVNDETIPAYAACCPHCGAVVGATVADNQHLEDTASTLAEWVMDGLVIERMTVGEARVAFGTCGCEEEPTS